MSYLYEQKLQIHSNQKDAYVKRFFHHSEIYTLFEELIHKPWGHGRWRPLIDVFEQEDLFRIKVDLPGVSGEEINVSVSDTKLFIEGRRPFEKDSESEEIQMCERPSGVFFREIEFFERLSAGDIQKKYENGVLTVIVKKHGNK